MKTMMYMITLVFLTVAFAEGFEVRRVVKREVPCGKTTCASGEFCLDEKCRSPCEGTLCLVGVEDCNAGTCVPKAKLQKESCGSTKCTVGDRCVNGKCRFPCGGNLCYTGEDYCDSDKCVPNPVCGHGARLVGRKCMIDCIKDTCDADTQQCNATGKCEDKSGVSCATFVCGPMTYCEMRDGRPFCVWLKS